jgi:hypothetical protein
MVDIDDKVEYKTGIKIEIEHDMENSIDKMKAGTKAIDKKMGDLDRPQN